MTKCKKANKTSVKIKRFVGGADDFWRFASQVGSPRSGSLTFEERKKQSCQPSANCMFVYVRAGSMSVLNAVREKWEGELCERRRLLKECKNIE